MPDARVTFVVEAYGADAAGRLSDTLRSLAASAHRAVGAAVLTDPAGLPGVRGLLDAGPPLYAAGGPGRPAAPACFNKAPMGVPAFCLGFGEGVVRKADALNAAVEEAWGGSDVFVPLSAGDTVRADYCGRVVAAFEQGLGEVGGVVADRLEARGGADLRVYEEPYARDRVLVNLWQPPAAAVGRYALERVGRYDPGAAPGEEYDLWLRVTERFVVLHLPDPLVRVVPRVPPPPADAARAWRRAVLTANSRADRR